MKLADVIEFSLMIYNQKSAVIVSIVQWNMTDILASFIAITTELVSYCVCDIVLQTEVFNFSRKLLGEICTAPWLELQQFESFRQST